MMMRLDVGVADLEAGTQWAVDQGARLNTNRRPR
jgi:hypothetical protein